MTIPNINYRLIFKHLLIWVGYITYEQSIILVTGTAQLSLWETLLNFVLYAAVFYISAQLFLPFFYKPKRYATFVGLLICLMVLYLGARYAINFYLLPMITSESLRMAASQRIFVAQSLYRGIYFLLLSFGYWFALDSIALEKHRREQSVKLQIVEKNLVYSELLFLKSQINPHFLFNALNFLYARILPLSEETGQAVLLLSDIMRYALTTDGQEGKAMLSDEVQHLRNYILINQLRFSNNLQIQFETRGGYQFLMILPLILITFVENCFKHGELSDFTDPLVIHLSTEQNILTFHARNKIRTGPKESSSGIGLDNTKKRLDLVYPNRYYLEITKTKEHYSTHLVIHL